MTSKILSLFFISITILSGCGFSAPTLSASAAEKTISGEWVGTASSIAAIESVLKGNLKQGEKQSDGSTMFSGTLTFKGCLKSIDVSGKIQDGSVALIGNSAGSDFSFIGTINNSNSAINGRYTLSAGSVCIRDAGAIDLKKQ